MRTIKEALEDGSLSLEDEIDYDDTPEAEEIALLKLEIERLNNIINELEKDLYKIRELTFKKYNSNEWDNCLSFNDDILPVVNKLKELKGSDK